MASNSLTVNQLGGSVTTSGLTVADWCAETFGDPCVTGTFENDDIHLTGLPQGALGWNAFTGNIRFNIPAGSGDVAGYDVLQFRTEVNPSYAANTGVALQNLSVELVDGSGGSASVAASSVPNDDALIYPEGIPNGHVIMNQIRFPLSHVHRRGPDRRDPGAPGLRPDEQGRHRRVGHGLHQGRWPGYIRAVARGTRRHAAAPPSRVQEWSAGGLLCS